MGIAQFAAGQRVRAVDLNQLPVVVSYLATGSVANSAAETVIGTLTIPAGDPTFPGGYWWKIFGTAAETASPTITIRMRVNSLAGLAIVAPGAITTSFSPTMFIIDGWLTFQAIGVSGSFSTWSIFGHDFAATGTVGSPGIQTAVALNTTVSNTLVVTAQFSAANASNTAATVGGAMYRL